MKSDQAHGDSFIHRWLSRTSNHASYDCSDVESLSTQSFPPPPLTDTSSTADSISTIPTPKTSYTRSPAPLKSSSRFSAVKPPCTPPTKYAVLPSGPTANSRKVAVSLPANVRQSSALVLARPPLKLHRLLNYDPTRRALIFDVTLPTSYILQCPPTSQSTIVIWRQPRRPHPPISPKPILDSDLTQYATTPPVTCMKIITNRLPWTINVYGRTTAQSDPRTFVRVGDVFDAIYGSLRTGVPSDEWNRANKPFKDQVKKAYLRRCRASRPFTLTGYEEKQGVRRVDYLHDNTMFLGLTIKTHTEEHNGRLLSAESTEDGIWVMMLEPRPT